MENIIRRAIIGILALAVALPAAAAEHVLPLKPDEPYRHAPSGMQVPVVLDALPRKQVTSYAESQLDDVVQFESADGGERLTVYVFRNVTGSVPVWFDRIRSEIGRPDGVFGDITALEAPAPFVPPHQANPSALMQSFVTGKGPFRGTAAALIPMGPDWYVALRYSSNTLSADAIAEHLPRTIAALGWPDKIADQPVAALVAPCAAPLASVAKARQVPADGASAIAASLMMIKVPEEEKKEKPEPAAPPTSWCRDVAPAGADASVYRPLDSADSYLIALGDAGRGIWVARDTIGALLSKSAKPRWAVTMIDVAQNTVYPAFDALPAPAKAAEVVNQGKPMVSVSTWGKDSNITISSDALKK